MIISASRRTDIPAFYSTWLLNRLKAGYSCTRNPMNPHQISKVPLTRDVVDGIVFWTKNPAPMMRNAELMELLKDYPYYVQFTLTGYGTDVEPHVPRVEDSVFTFQKLAERIGPERVIWRYDPILLSDTYTIDYHVKHFQQLADALAESTKRVVISFIDMYRKIECTMASLGVRAPSADEMNQLAASLAEIAHDHGFQMTTCAEPVDLEAYGITHGSCIDKTLLERIGGYRFSSKLGKDKMQRPECRCCSSIDIGAYNTCAHGCRYCYANSSDASVRKNVAAHDPESPLLVGHVLPDDKITERKVQSFIEGVNGSPASQLSLFE